MSWVSRLYDAIVGFLAYYYDKFWQGLQYIEMVLNPFYWISRAFIAILGFLPDDFGVDFSPIITMFNSVSHFFSWIDYWVDLKVLVSTIAIVGLFEGGAAVIRLWRILRSLVI